MLSVPRLSVTSEWLCICYCHCVQPSINEKHTPLINYDKTTTTLLVCTPESGMICSKCKLLLLPYLLFYHLRQLGDTVFTQCVCFIVCLSQFLLYLIKECCNINDILLTYRWGCVNMQDTLHLDVIDDAPKSGWTFQIAITHSVFFVQRENKYFQNLIHETSSWHIKVSVSVSVSTIVTGRISKPISGLLKTNIIYILASNSLEICKQENKIM